MYVSAAVYVDYLAPAAMRGCHRCIGYAYSILLIGTNGIGARGLSDLLCVTEGLLGHEGVIAIRLNFINA